MVRHFFRLLIVWGATFCVALFLAAFALPWFFQWYEIWRGVPLPYEGALRFTMIATIETILVGSLAWLFIRGGRQHWAFWWIGVASYASLLIVFFGDTTHRLMEEFSWIRYTTTAFLLLASVAAGFCAAWYRRERREFRFLFLFWCMIAGAFFYAGLDEVFELHEAIGRFIMRTTGWSSSITDFVTIGYAVTAILVLVLFFRSFLAEYRSHRFFLFTFITGGAVYFVSTLFDTVDFFVLDKLRVIANTLSINASFVFGDGWAVLWAPRNFFNGWEEVLEHTAAILFFAAPLLLYLEKRGVLRFSSSPVSVRRKPLAYGIIALLVLFFIFSLTLSFPYIFTRAPLVATRGALVVSRIAGYFDGLSHTDDLFYHPRWGVLVANEGKGNVYRWNNGRWGMVPDPKKALRDTDSVTADAASIYVSDGSQGTIFRTDGKGEWEALWTKSDGLRHPEGIVVVDGALYVIDESEKSITKLVRGEKPDVWRPSHPDWRAPEGIAYDKERETLVVTDDVSGAVFAVDFGTSVYPLAKFSNPEDIVVAPDGRILVTDNGWGAVFAINRDGTIGKLAQFRRSYRDVQGITVDDVGRLYVVTADGFDRVSFMPSMLFRITNQE